MQVNNYDSIHRTRTPFQSLPAIAEAPKPQMLQSIQTCMPDMTQISVNPLTQIPAVQLTQTPANHLTQTPMNHLTQTPMNHLRLL